MKTFFATILLVVGFSTLSVAENPPVLPDIQKQTGWISTGTDSKGSISPVTAFELPAGAQLSRTLPPAAFILHQISRPQFAQAIDDWPIIVIGPNALVFKQANGRGQLMLASGDGSSQVLSNSWSLDDSGYANQPVDVLVGYDPVSGVVVLAVDGISYSFRSPSAEGAIAVSISAGAGNPWIQDTLSVDILSDKDILPSATDKGDPGAVAAKIAGIDQLRVAVKTSNDAAAENVTPDIAALGKNVPASTKRVALEVSTPPAVRKWNPQLIRSLAIAAALKHAQ